MAPREASIYSHASTYTNSPANGGFLQFPAIASAKPRARELCNFPFNLQERCNVLIIRELILFEMAFYNKTIIYKKNHNTVITIIRQLKVEESWKNRKLLRPQKDRGYLARVPPSLRVYARNALLDMDINPGPRASCERWRKT